MPKINSLSKKCFKIAPRSKPSSSTQPFDFIQRLARLFRENLPSEKQLTVGQIQDFLNKHIGPSATHTYKDELVQALSILCAHLQGAELKVDQKTGIVNLLLEDIQECTPGFHIRVNRTLIQLTRPRTLPEYLERLRFNLIEEMQRVVSDDSHNYNRFFIVANKHGYGVLPPFEKDPYKPNLSDSIILDLLKETFAQRYHPLEIHHQLLELFIGECQFDGYSGYNPQGYTMGVYEAILTKMQHLLDMPTLTLQTAFVIDENSSLIVDIHLLNLQNLVWQKLTHENYFHLTKQDKRDLNALLITEMTHESIARLLSHPLYRDLSIQFLSSSYLNRPKKMQILYALERSFLDQFHTFEGLKSFEEVFTNPTPPYAIPLDEDLQHQWLRWIHKKHTDLFVDAIKKGDPQILTWIQHLKKWSMETQTLFFLKTYEEDLGRNVFLLAICHHPALVLPLYELIKPLQSERNDILFPKDNDGNNLMDLALKNTSSLTHVLTIMAEIPETEALTLCMNVQNTLWINAMQRLIFDQAEDNPEIRFKILQFPPALQTLLVQKLTQSIGHDLLRSLSEKEITTWIALRWIALLPKEEQLRVFMTKDGQSQSAIALAAHRNNPAFLPILEQIRTLEPVQQFYIINQTETRDENINLLGYLSNLSPCKAHTLLEVVQKLPTEFSTLIFSSFTQKKALLHWISARNYHLVQSYLKAMAHLPTSDLISILKKPIYSAYNVFSLALCLAPNILDFELMIDAIPKLVRDELIADLEKSDKTFLINDPRPTTFINLGHLLSNMTLLPTTLQHALLDIIPNALWNTLCEIDFIESTRIAFHLLEQDLKRAMLDKIQLPLSAHFLTAVYTKPTVISAFLSLYKHLNASEKEAFLRANLVKAIEYTIATKNYLTLNNMLRLLNIAILPTLLDPESNSNVYTILLHRCGTLDTVSALIRDLPLAQRTKIIIAAIEALLKHFYSVSCIPVLELFFELSPESRAIFYALKLEKSEILDYIARLLSENATYAQINLLTLAQTLHEFPPAERPMLLHQFGFNERDLTKTLSKVLHAKDWGWIEALSHAIHLLPETQRARCLLPSFNHSNFLHLALENAQASKSLLKLISTLHPEHQSKILSYTNTSNHNALCLIHIYHEDVAAKKLTQQLFTLLQRLPYADYIKIFHNFQHAFQLHTLAKRSRQYPYDLHLRLLFSHLKIGIDTMQDPDIAAILNPLMHQLTLLFTAFWSLPPTKFLISRLREQTFMAFEIANHQIREAIPYARRVQLRARDNDHLFFKREHSIKKEIIDTLDQLNTIPEL